MVGEEPRFGGVFRIPPHASLNIGTGMPPSLGRKASVTGVATMAPPPL
jgi:hypothetical protein